MLTATRAIGTARESALSPEQDPADQITLVSWNLHYGVDPAGAVEPEQVARTIEAQHREENTPTRLDQIATLLAAEGDAPVAVIAGDFNAEPGWPEIELLTRDNGWVSAQDVAGDPAALTSPSVDPQDRIDRVLGRGMTFLGAEVRGDALSSDHLRLVIPRPDGPIGDAQD